MSKGNCLPDADLQDFPKGNVPINNNPQQPCIYRESCDWRVILNSLPLFVGCLGKCYYCIISLFILNLLGCRWWGFCLLLIESMFTAAACFQRLCTNNLVERQTKMTDSDYNFLLDRGMLLKLQWPSTQQLDKVCPTTTTTQTGAEVKAYRTIHH